MQSQTEEKTNRVRRALEDLHDDSYLMSFLVMTTFSTIYFWCWFQVPSDYFVIYGFFYPVIAFIFTTASVYLLKIKNGDEYGKSSLIMIALFFILGAFIFAMLLLQAAFQGA